MNKSRIIKIMGMLAALLGAGVTALNGDYTQAVAIVGAALSSANLSPKGGT